MYSMDPKELRKKARELNALASQIEMMQNPQKVIEKKAKAKYNGIKRKARNDVIKKMTGL